MDFKIDELQDFLNHYNKHYDNFYSERFKKLDLRKGRVENNEIYKDLRESMIKKGIKPHIVYEIIDKKKDWIRVGRSSFNKNQRLKWYLSRAFSPNLPSNLSNIYHEMAKCDTKQDVRNRFVIEVRYIFSRKGEAQVMEEFLTIFRNRANNSVGYDLNINNKYNKIVGDLFKDELDGNFLSSHLNPKWSDVSPIELAEAVLNGLSMRKLKKKFEVSRKTIRRRFRAYGYGAKGIYDLKDARAYLLIPYIIEGFLKGLNQQNFFKYCTDQGIYIFNKYEFFANRANPRGRFFRSMLKRIWGTSKHKEARYKVLAEYIISIIDRPDITPGEAEKELRKFIDFKYDREFARICRQVFGMPFTQKRDEIFKNRIKKLALKNMNESKIKLRIAINLGLCKEEDPVKTRERATNWIKQYIHRNFGTYSVRDFACGLQPELFDYKSLKQQVFEYMHRNPIDKPKEVFKHFEDQNIETIRGYVKLWKNNNRKLVNKWLDPIFLFSKYANKIILDEEILKASIKLLKIFKSKGLKDFRQQDLKVNPKGIVAGAIYLSSKVIGKKITQSELKNSLGVCTHTISKRAKDLKSLAKKENLF